MFCYKCGCELNGSNRCPNCGTDVSRYKKIIYTSNYLYNEGLERAGVRDLSGAILSLKQSLWYNKDNLQARNLLGLIYFEMGESVAALSEWLISKNINDERLHEKDNKAEEYLAQVLNSRTQVENIHNTIAKYNLALQRCYSDNLDVALIQLKKVLQLTPGYLRARQLLALLYMERGDWRRAQHELKRCQKQDMNNTTTLRYLKEIEAQLNPEQGTAAAGTVRDRGEKKGDGIVSYTRDNETIIQPAGAKSPSLENRGGFPAMLTGLAIGLVIGAVAVAFLIMPNRVQAMRNQGTEEVRAVSEKLDASQAKVDELQNQIDDLTNEKDDLTEALSEYQSTDGSESQTDLLQKAAAAYVGANGDLTSAVAAFEKVDPIDSDSVVSDSFRQLYNSLAAAMQPQLLSAYTQAGFAAYDAESPDLASVIDNLEKALRYETETPDENYTKILWELGDAYYRQYMDADSESRTDLSENLAKAREYLEKITNDYPDSDYASTAQERLLDIATDTTAEQ